MSRLSKHVPFLHPAVWDFRMYHSDQAAVESGNSWHINCVFTHQFSIVFPESQSTARGIRTCPTSNTSRYTALLMYSLPGSYSYMLQMMAIIGLALSEHKDYVQCHPEMLSTVSVCGSCDCTQRSHTGIRQL